MQRRSILKNLGLLCGGLVLPKTILANEPLKNKPTRIAHITDIHIQPHIGAAKGFERCLHHIQGLSQPVDLVINGGDAIMGAHHASAGGIQKQWDLYKSVMKSENSLPVYNCVGNHDIFRKSDNLAAFEGGKQRAMDHLEMSKSYYSVDLDPWKVIVLDGVQGKVNAKGYQGMIDEQQMDWLRKILFATPKDTFILIVTHIPILSACVFLDGKNFKNGEWRVPETWMHADAEDLVELFAKFPNVKLAISGHIHLSDRIDYNGMTYCCNGAVSGNWWMGSYKQTQPGYAIIDLYSDGTFQNTYQTYS